MNYRKLYTVEKFRPVRRTRTPANGGVVRRPSSLIQRGTEARDKRSGSRKEEPAEIHRFVDLKDSVEPLRYAIDGVVRRGRIYTLTAPTNAGKTTWSTMAALAVATGRSDILNLGVEKGRVVYLAIENPDDTISRFAIAQRFYDIPDSALRRLFIVTTKATPESVFVALKELSKSGRFALVIVDTLAAYFDGTDLNDNVAAGDFMRRLRALTTILGNPAVVVPAHPVKAAAQGSLSPYGGGAIVNEVDGNLTLWRARDACKLHWQTKLRGPDFEPVLFSFRNHSCDEVRDARRRRVIMPLLVPYGETPAKALALPAPNRVQPRSQDDVQRADEATAPVRLPDRSRDRLRSAGTADLHRDKRLLRAMIANPDGTQADWATATSVAKSNVNRRLKRLKGEGLVRGARGRWTVTTTGKGMV